ncbi:MAG: hypothetical protein ABIP49_10425 [Lysobacterales bacterium]
MSAVDLSHQLHQIADQMSPRANWDDVIELARFRKAVHAGIAAADLGEFARDEEVRRVFRTWGVDVEA